MESLFTLAIFLQVLLLPYSISSQKIGCIDGRQQSILARELEHWNCIPLGKSTSQKGPQWKQMDFLPLLTIGCQTQAASRTGFFCKLLLRQSIHLNKIFFLSFFFWRKVLLKMLESLPSKSHGRSSSWKLTNHLIYSEVQVLRDVGFRVLFQGFLFLLPSGDL